MIVTGYLSILAAVLGLILYFVSTKGEVKEVGRLLFFCGALVFLLSQSGASSGVRLGR